MKKIAFILLSCILLFSCNVKTSKEYKALKSERDSLVKQIATTNEELDEMTEVINAVEDNFAKIKEAEKYLTIESGKTGELTSSARGRVEDNFKIISDVLKQSKVDLDRLNNKLENSKGNISVLKKTIDRLNGELKNSTEALYSLQTELAKRDNDIKELIEDVSLLADRVEEQTETISIQDKALNRAFYVFGTSKELKDQKIISKGLFSSTKVLKDSFNEDYFIKIDIRDVTRIPLLDKRAELLSTHPEGSYLIEKDNDGLITFVITDTQRFWSLTKYLVIEVG